MKKKGGFDLVVYLKWPTVLFRHCCTLWSYIDDMILTNWQLTIDKAVRWGEELLLEGSWLVLSGESSACCAYHMVGYCLNEASKVKKKKKKKKKMHEISTIHLPLRSRDFNLNIVKYQLINLNANHNSPKPILSIMPLRLQDLCDLVGLFYIYIFPPLQFKVSHT